MYIICKHKSDLQIAEMNYKVLLNYIFNVRNSNSSESIVYCMHIAVLIYICIHNIVYVPRILKVLPNERVNCSLFCVIIMSIKNI